MGSRFQGPTMSRVLAFSALLIHLSLGCSVVSERSRRSTSLPDHGERSLLHRDLMEGYEKDVIPMKAAPNADNEANAVVFNLGASVIRMDMKNSKDYSCHMKVGSWTYDAFHLGLAPFDNKTHLDLENVQRESPYLITSQDGDAMTTKYYDCCKEPYQSMEYKFTVRKSSALPASLDDYFASYKTDMLVTSNPKTTKLRGN